MSFPPPQQTVPAHYTNQPGDVSTGNSQFHPESTGYNNNFEYSHDKVLDANKMNYMAIMNNNGYVNNERFDPNYMNYYERQPYPQ